MSLLSLSQSQFSPERHRQKKAHPGSRIFQRCPTFRWSDESFFPFWAKFLSHLKEDGIEEVVQAPDRLQEPLRTVQKKVDNKENIEHELQRTMLKNAFKMLKNASNDIQ